MEDCVHPGPGPRASSAHRIPGLVAAGATTGRRRFLASVATGAAPGWHEPGTTNEFVFNKKAYDGLPIDLQRTLDHAAAAVGPYTLAEYDAKNAVALDKLRAEFKGKVEVLPLPARVLRELKKMSSEVVRTESERSPMARRVHASFAKFQALVEPWDHAAEGAYHQLVAG